MIYIPDSNGDMHRITKHATECIDSGVTHVYAITTNNIFYRTHNCQLKSAYDVLSEHDEIEYIKPIRREHLHYVCGVGYLYNTAKSEIVKSDLDPKLRVLYYDDQIMILKDLSSGRLWIECDHKTVDIDLPDDATIICCSVHMGVAFIRFEDSRGAWKYVPGHSLVLLEESWGPLSPYPNQVIYHGLHIDREEGMYTISQHTSGTIVQTNLDLSHLF